MLKLILLNENFHSGSLISHDFLFFFLAPYLKPIITLKSVDYVVTMVCQANLLAGAKPVFSFFLSVDVWSGCKSCAAEVTSGASLAEPVWAAASYQAG